jgi:predicted nucleic acid-binding protein
VTKLALDTSALIYLVEGSSTAHEQLSRRVGAVLAQPDGQVVASRLARMECRVKPVRDGNQAVLDEYEAVFNAVEFTLLDVTTDVLERATELRARHGFKVPDAIQLASAIEASVDAFITGDARLKKCPGLNVEVVAP